MSESLYGPRERSTEKTSTLPWYVWQHSTLSKHNPSLQGSGSFVSEYQAKTLNDVTTANFHENLNAGRIIPTNPYLKVTESSFQTCASFDIKSVYPYVGRPGDYTRRYGDMPVADNTTMLSLSGFNAEHKQAIYDAVITKARGKMTSNKMLLLATIKELGATRQMFIGAAQAAKRAMRFSRNFLRKLKKSAPWSTARWTADNSLSLWMEFRMGWRPFIGDVDNLMKSIASKYEVYDRQKFGACDGDSVFIEDEFNTGDSERLWTVRRRSEITYFVKSGVLASKRTSGYPDTYGMSLNSLGKTAWEITPFSWLVDYFYNVGDYIASRTPDTLWRSEDHFVTVVERYKQSATWDGRPNAPRWNGSVGSGYKEIVTETIQRVPAVLPETITFSPKLNWAKYIDSAAAGKDLWKSVVKTATPLFKAMRKRS